MRVNVHVFFFFAPDVHEVVRAQFTVCVCVCEMRIARL